MPVTTQGINHTNVIPVVHNPPKKVIWRDISVSTQGINHINVISCAQFSRNSNLKTHVSNQGPYKYDMWRTILTTWLFQGSYLYLHWGKNRSNVIPVVLNYHKVTLEESCPYPDGSRDKPYKCCVSSHEVIIWRHKDPPNMIPSFCTSHKVVLWITLSVSTLARNPINVVTIMHILYLSLPVIGLHLQLNKTRYTAPAQSGCTR